MILKRTLTFIFVLSVISTFVGCFSPHSVFADSGPIGIVKNGVLKDYPSTTVGKAFEGTFQNGKWKSFETPKGATVVEFDGTISSAGIAPMKMESRDGIWTTMGQLIGPSRRDNIPAQFQFTLNADRAAFDITYVGLDNVRLTSRASKFLMAFIYQ